MSAAILQGTPATTIDTDIWVDLSEREYLRVHNVCREQGATILAPTAVALSDDTLVNFLFRVDGLKSFGAELKKAVRVKWMGTTVKVMPLESILKSKRAVARPKDLAHIPLLEETIRLKKKMS